MYFGIFSCLVSAGDRFFGRCDPSKSRNAFLFGKPGLSTPRSWQGRVSARGSWKYVARLCDVAAPGGLHGRATYRKATSAQHNYPIRQSGWASFHLFSIEWSRIFVQGGFPQTQIVLYSIGIFEYITNERYSVFCG